MGCASSMKKLCDILLVLLHPVDAKQYKSVGHEKQNSWGGGGDLINVASVWISCFIQLSSSVPNLHGCDLFSVFE